MSVEIHEVEVVPVQHIKNHPRFKNLVNKRNRLAMILTLIMVVAYYGFIALIAFNKSLLAQKIGSGVLTIGIPIGLVLIILSIVLTWYFVHKANGTFDVMCDEMLNDIKKNRE